MSAEDRVAEVLAAHYVADTRQSQWVGHGDEAVCKCGSVEPLTTFSSHLAAILAAAGLLAPPPPRTWRAGEPEPDDVRCVVDRSGDLWVRERGKNYEWPWFQAESEIGESWECVTAFSPLTEVRLP